MSTRHRYFLWLCLLTGHCFKLPPIFFNEKIGVWSRITTTLLAAIVLLCSYMLCNNIQSVSHLFKMKSRTEWSITSLTAWLCAMWLVSRDVSKCALSTAPINFGISYQRQFSVESPAFDNIVGAAADWLTECRERREVSTPLLAVSCEKDWAVAATERACQRGASCLSLILGRDTLTTVSKSNAGLSSLNFLSSRYFVLWIKLVVSGTRSDLFTLYK